MNKRIVMIMIIVVFIIVCGVTVFYVVSDNKNSYDDYTDTEMLKDNIIDMLDTDMLSSTYGIDCSGVSIDDVYFTDDGKAYIYVTSIDGTPYKITIDGNTVYVDAIENDAVEAPI